MCRRILIMLNYLKKLRLMSNEERELLIKALEIAEYKTLYEKAKKNEMVVHCTDDGVLYEEPARVVFERLYHEPYPTY